MTSGDRQNYWHHHLSRRKVLRGVVFGTVGLGVAGCAGSPPAPTAAPASGGAAPAPAAPTPAPAATVAPQPKRGGTLKTMSTGVERSLEPHLIGAIPGTASFGPQICYSTLLGYKRGPDVKAPSYIPAGDLAESWQQTDDLTYVFKLRQGVKW